MLLTQTYSCLFKLPRLLPPPFSHSGSCEEQLEKAQTYLHKAQRVERVERRARKMSSEPSCWISGDDCCGPGGVQAQGIRMHWSCCSVKVPVHIVDFWILKTSKYFWCLSWSGDANEFQGANTRVKQRIQELWNRQCSCVVPFLWLLCRRSKQLKRLVWPCKLIHGESWWSNPPVFCSNFLRQKRWPKVTEIMSKFSCFGVVLRRSRIGAQLSDPH